MRGLVTALRTLTVLPVPGKDAVRFSSSLHWFPVVGFLLGIVEAGFGYLVMLSGWSEIAAAGVLLVGVVVTRGIHADGFADVIDGFFGGTTVEARLRIMKDPAVGSFGAVALILLFLFKWVVLVRLLSLGLYVWIVAGVMLARLVQVIVASSLPYARSEGGTAAGFVEGAGALHIFVAILLSVIGLVIVSNGMLLPGGIALFTALLSAGLTALVSLKKIRGVTGDILGASSEITEVLVWSAVAFWVEVPFI